MDDEDSKLSRADEVRAMWEGINAPMARCSLCVGRYGGAPRTDDLILVTKNGRDRLACMQHYGQKWEEVLDNEKRLELWS